MYYGKCANGECVSKLTVRAIARTGKRLFSVASKKLTEFLVLLFHFFRAIFDTSFKP